MSGTNSLLDYDIPELNHEIPSIARVYANYVGWQGGVYPADQRMAEFLDEVFPGIRQLAIHNRKSLFNIVRYVVEKLGIRQIFDHGTGLPVMGSVYEVAHAIDPSTRVILVDHDPVVLAECLSQGIELPGNVAYRKLDMRSPRYVQDLMSDTRVMGLINPREPVAHLFISVIHCLADSTKPLRMVEMVKERSAPGSAIGLWGLTSGTLQGRGLLTGTMAELTAEDPTGPGWGRCLRPDEYDRYFHGLDPIGQGIGPVVVWGGEAEDVQSVNLTEYGGAGLVRAA